MSAEPRTEECAFCRGGEAREVVVMKQVTVCGVVEAYSVPVFDCSRCGEVYQDSGQIDREDAERYCAERRVSTRMKIFMP